jgi:hypothetical protein
LSRNGSRKPLIYNHNKGGKREKIAADDKRKNTVLFLVSANKNIDPY